MPLPYPNTIARDKVLQNVAALEREGHLRNQAIAQSFNAARQAYFKRFPSGLLPEWLAFRKGYRSAQYYAKSGEFLQGNPLPVATKKAARLYRAFTGHAPVNAVGATVRGAGFDTGFIVGNVLGVDLEDRNGLPVGHLKFTPADDRPALAISADGRKVVFIGGDYAPVSNFLDNLVVIGIMYETVRDGKHENYHHAFSRNARPLLSVIDGRNAKMSGGSFRFTDRGFVDFRK